MNANEYSELARRTENTPEFIRRDGLIRVDEPPHHMARLIHAGFGMVTESAEFIDQLKKHIMYGKPLDRVNLLEEAGDLLWYVALAIHTCGSTFEAVWQRNIQKLRVRFPDKFTSENAIVRDLEAERKALEE